VRVVGPCTPGATGPPDMRMTSLEHRSKVREAFLLFFFLSFFETGSHYVA
jgi:hypothetical protein